VAAKRLKAIEQYAMLGAGFKIAMRDLEIRGAGNLLGPEQSGNIAAVGYEMYCHLLERETRKLRNESIIEPGRTHLELPVSGQLPRNYITSAKYRMDAYRRISRATTLAQLEQVSRDLTDAYGPLPAAAATLMQLAELRIAASTHEIDSIKLEGPDLIFRTRHVKRLDPLLRNAPGRASIIDENTVYYRPPANYLDPPSTLLAVLRKLLVRPLQSDAAA
jgi:transcription-repair coupling factor (superfamily II helicase)